MVTPPAFIAATPVGATTTIRFGDDFFRLRRKVVFPVPAFPVRKMLRLVYLTKSKAKLRSWFVTVSIIYFTALSDETYSLLI
jgi:hypothetical protein